MAVSGGAQGRQGFAPVPRGVDRPFLGIALLVGAVTLFSCLDSCAKWVNRGGDPLMTAAFRYIGNFVLVALACGAVTPSRVPRARAPGLQVLRGLFLVVATISSFFALKHLPLTQATAINFAAPLVVALIAGPVLHEWPGPRRLAAVGVGFVGVLVVTRPWAGPLQPAMLLALLTAFANAFYAVATRLLASRDAPLTTIFWAAAVGSAVFLPVLPCVWSPPPSPGVWIALAGTGVFGALGHWLLVLANRHARASTLAPFFYAQILGATAIGYVVFGEVPDRWTALGAAIVTGSGLYLLLRERTRGVEPAPEVVP